MMVDIGEPLGGSKPLQEMTVGLTGLAGMPEDLRQGLLMFAYEKYKTALNPDPITEIAPVKVHINIGVSMTFDGTVTKEYLEQASNGRWKPQ